MTDVLERVGGREARAGGQLTGKPPAGANAGALLEHASGLLASGLLDDTEELVVCHDRRTGLQAVIAVDDTTLGPGLGGVRWMPYEDEASAAAEATRLARVMTLKNALAGIPYGGAKSVIWSDRLPAGPDRRATLRAFGSFVARLHGAYVPGVDMGTSVDDLAEIAAVAPDVSCDHEDPSPSTALGVFAGIRAAVAEVDGPGLAGKTVLVQGAGHVGRALAHCLAGAGALVAVADVDEALAAAVAAEVGGSVVGPEAVTGYRCDVWAPCATARVVRAGNAGNAGNPGNAGALGCRIVAGAANDVLAERGCAKVLADHGVTYVPDFLLNAGGVVHIHAVRSGWVPDQLEAAVLNIGDRVHEVLQVARRSGRLPVDVAEQLASSRLGRSIGIPA